MQNKPWLPYLATKKRIVSTYEEAQQIQNGGTARFSGVVQLTHEDIVSLLQGKFIVHCGDWYNEMIYINKDETNNR